MKNYSLLLVLYVLFFCLSINPSHASHVMGADLTYRCISGLQYEITLALYRDCAGFGLGSTETVMLRSASCNQNISLTVTRISITEVSPICQSQLSNTTCGGSGTLNGAEEHIYRAITTLPVNCADWVFSFETCCRNGAITTLLSPTATDIYVESFLNSIAAPCNSSPTFSNQPVSFVCLNTPLTYNNGATDADGDSLVYTLISALRDDAVPVSYNGNFSATAPLSSNPPITLDNNNGTVDLAPAQLQVGVMAILVEEYRNNVLIGSVRRDIQVQVINCGTNSSPVFNPVSNLSGGLQPSPYRIEVCPGQSLSFNVNIADPNSGDTLTVISNNAITGSSWSTTGVNPVIGTFSWTPTTADVGFHSLVLTVEDDACPFKGIQSIGLEIWVLGGANAGPDLETCANGSQPATLSAVGGSTFSWRVLSGDTSSIACATCPNQVVTPSTTTIYEVQTNFACGNKDTVAVTVNPVTALTTSQDTSICGASTSVQLSSTPANPGVYNYSWSPTVGLSNATISNPVATVGASTSYFVTVTDTNNCVLDDSVNIAVAGNLLDGSPTGTSDIYCDGGTPVRLYANAANGDCEAYALSSIPHSPQITAFNSLSLTDDAVTQINMGMNFDFFCNSYSSITISSNGWISFNTYGTGQSAPSDVPMPNVGDPNNIIALAWDDLNPGSGGSISYGLLGTAPNRVFIVNYNQVPHFGSASQTVTGQIILYESTGVIELHCTHIQNDGGSLLQGIEGPNGAKAFPLTGRNGALWSAVNEAYRFTPATPQPFSISWQSPLGTTIGMGDSIDVSPNANTAYYAIITDSVSGCTDTLSPAVHAALNVSVARVDAGPNQIIPYGAQANLDGSYIGPLPTPLCTDYMSLSIPFLPHSLSSPTHLSLLNGAPNFSSALPIGFDFEFYCQNYSAVYICSGGYLTFDNGISNATPTSIPTAALPNNMIAFAWSSLDSMDINYETQGVAPSRRFVIDIQSVHFFSQAFNPPFGDPVNVQIVLHETGEIDMHMSQITPSWFSAMTQGIEGPNGSNGLAISGRNAVLPPTGISTTNEGLRFELRPATINYAWTPPITLNDSSLEDPVASPLVDTWYYLTVDNGACVLTDSVLVSIQPLPIELVDFYVKLVDNQSILHWETSFEQDADFFALEHSSDGLHFNKIGQVDAIGESNARQPYSFIHESPDWGFNWYRLQGVDQDGQVQFSKSTELYIDGSTTNLAVDVHPNPSSGLFRFEFLQPIEGLTQLEIINLEGKIVLQKTMEMNAGKNTIQVDLSEFAHGLYLYRLSTNDLIHIGKLKLKP